jgi:hypothetical protein
MLPIQEVLTVLCERLEKMQGIEISTSSQSRFVLTLQPLPYVDPVRSLRWVLKGLLRQHGMRCVDIREIKHE